MKIKLLFVTIFLTCVSYSQNKDSIQIEKDFLSSIGNAVKLDSLEKVIYQKSKHNFVLEDTYWYNLSKAQFLSGEIDKAFSSAEKGILLCQKNKDNYREAKFYNLKASVFAYRNDNEKAIASFKKALAIVEKSNNLKTAASIRNNIANIFFGLSDYESAYKYSFDAYHQLVKDKDTVNLPSVSGILAISLIKLGKIDEGIQLANKAISMSEKYKNPIGLIVGHHSLGEALIGQEKYDEAILSLMKSLELSTMYRQGHFIMLNKVAIQHAYLMNSDYNKSIEYGLLAKEETQNLKNENTLYAINKNLAYAYENIGNKELAFQYLSSAHDSYIKSSGTENQKTINEILIKYDTEKKEKDLVQSRLENLKNQNKLIKRNQWILLLATLILLLLASYFFYNRLQKQKQIQLLKDQEAKRLIATITAEEKERERISNELHDGMASSITGIKMKLEDLSRDDNGTELKPLVNQLQKLHDETRRMSHNLMPLGLNRENWTVRLEEYCLENSSKQFKIQFSNNLNKIIAVDTSVSTLLYRSIQELINNAQKHAKTNSCIVQISKLNDELILSVEDEGIGFTEKILKGQGLSSIRQRLKQIGAQLEIESKPNAGSLVTISLKIAK